MVSKNNKGFTLLEVLLAITVLSILMSYIYTIVNESISTKDKVTAEDREYMQIQSALARIEIDLSQLYSPLYHTAKFGTQVPTTPGNDDFGQNPSVPGYAQEPKKSPFKFEASEKFPSISTTGQIVPAIENPDKSSLIFMSSANRRMLAGSKQSNFTWIKYELDSNKVTENKTGDPAKKGIALVRYSHAQNPFTKDFNWKEIKGYTLAENVKSLLFEFWDPDKKKYVDGLKFLDKSKDTPRLFKVTLEWFDLHGVEHTEIITIRPNWPYFDTLADEVAKKKVDKPKNSNNNNNNNGGPPL